MKIHCYGAARDISKEDTLEVMADENLTVGDLRKKLNELYPALAKLPSYMIAVNQTYAQDVDQISDHDEIAIIPPVSGG